MRLLIPLVVLSILPGTLLHADTTPPAITNVLNAASFSTQLSPGALATIFGTNLAASTVTAGTQPLPQNLSAATVMVNSVAAPLQYVSPTQINFLLPPTVELGPATVIVVNGGGKSSPANISVAFTSPGIFGSAGAALALNPDGSVNSPTNPVAQGATVSIYLTGVGPASGGPSVKGVFLSATVGNVPATVVGVTSTSTPGVSIASVQIPSLLPDGSYPTIITVGGAVSNAATIAVGKVSSNGVLTSLGAIAVPGPWSNVQLYGNVALLCGPPGIQPVDLGTPAAPTIPSNYSAVSTAGFLCAVQNNTVLQLNGTNGNGLNVYSLVDPTKPATLSSMTLPSLFVNSIVPAANVVYFSTDWYALTGATITGQYGEFYSYDFTNPKSPALRSQLLTDPNVPGSSDLSPRWKVALIDFNTAVIASTTATGGNTNKGTGLLQIVDVSTPPSSKIIATIALPNTAVSTGVAVQDGIALVVGNTAGWSNPAAPGQSAVFGGNLTISAVDVSSPQKPSLRSTLVPSPALPSSGTYSIVAIGHGRFAVAVGAPSSAVTTSMGTAIAAPPPGAAGVIGIVDASSPTSLTFTPVATVLTPGELAFANGLLLAPGANGLNIFQVNQNP